MKISKSNMILLILSLPLIDGSVVIRPMVDSPAGLIRGITAADGNYTKFLGIPYAQIDSKNPFGHSRPHPKFEGIFEANDDSTICPQYNHRTQIVEGSLDCLILSVYVPNGGKKNNLPVMVWIHEGAFLHGYIGREETKAQLLMKQDVILVMMNYRLGPYGFMCLDIPEIPGNQGLKDQVMALKWIQNNIKSFGGDKNRVTLFGLSAGSISIDFHFMYTDEKLFRRAILQSGSSLAATVIRQPDKEAPLKLSKYLGRPIDSIKDALTFLAASEPNAVAEAGLRLGLQFKPCIEKKFNDVEHFITESWINVKEPNVKSKEIMMGIAEYEKVFEFIVQPDFYIKRMDIIRNSLLEKFDFDEEKLTKMRDLVKLFYLGDKEINEDNILPLIDFLSDHTYVYPMQIAYKEYVANGAKKIYRYMFSYVGKRNFHQAFGNFTFNGAIHADELGYLFDFKDLPRSMAPEDQIIIDRITTLWANFAKYGNPTPERTSLLPVEWIPASRDQNLYLKIGSNLTMEDSLFHKRMAFWDLFYMMNENSQKFYTDVNNSTEKVSEPSIK